MSDTQTITKEKLAESLQSELGISRVICEEIISILFDEILNLVQIKDRVTINNFGKFYINYKNSRPGFNIRRRSSVAIAARKVLRFIPSRGFKNQINNDDR